MVLLYVSVVYINNSAEPAAATAYRAALCGVPFIASAC